MTARWHKKSCSFCGSPLLSDGRCSFVAGAPPAPADVLAEHRPHRGSDVEAWIKAFRDTYEKDYGARTTEWHAIDALLDDYRLRADTGLDLRSPIEEAGP